MDVIVPPEIDPEVFRRLEEINAEEGALPLSLRVAVLGGGCSGFSYEFALVNRAEDGDLQLKGKGQRVLIDEVSLPFLSSAVIAYEDSLVAQRFVIKNPNAVSTCGCGTSFAM